MSAICLNLQNTDIHYNLAVEEYLLKNRSEDVIMVWSSEDAIVVGKHQNALAELNHLAVRTNNIKVARRLTGGGTVFHDRGNLNFTLIRNISDSSATDYRGFLTPVVDVLKELGLAAYPHVHNSIFLEGKKISGNAWHVYRNRVLHHGTLLFDSRLSRLEEALSTDLSRFEGKSVQSNRSAVTNICGFLPSPVSFEEFRRYVFEGLVKRYGSGSLSTSEISSDSESGGLEKRYGIGNLVDLTDDEIREVEKLRNDKYTRWDWIYGYSPKYRYRHGLVTPPVSFVLSVEKGLIVDALWEGSLSGELSCQLSMSLRLQRHNYLSLKPVVMGLAGSLSREGIDAPELLEVLSGG